MAFQPFQIDGVIEKYAELKSEDDQDADDLRAITADHRLDEGEWERLEAIAARMQERKRRRQWVYLKLEDWELAVLEFVHRLRTDRNDGESGHRLKSRREANEAAWAEYNGVTSIAPYLSRRNPRGAA